MVEAAGIEHAFSRMESRFADPFGPKPDRVESIKAAIIGT
jgi:hypothetical protein